MSVTGIVQPPLGLLGHEFAGGYKFPVRGRRKREAALRDLRRMATWDVHDIENVDYLDRTARLGQASGATPDAVVRLVKMLREACARAAKYQVAAESLAHRLDKTEARRR
jgi:hypothetical protein